MKKALVIVDPQLDFMPGGSLAIPHGDEIVPHINELINKEHWNIIVVTRDWHPINHKCFTTINKKNVLDIVDINGKPVVVWPPHCVQNTEGAKFHPDLNLDGAVLFTKGDDINEHPFTGTAGKHNGIPLINYLENLDIEYCYVVGLAGDYCLKDTALDLSEHFEVLFDMKGTRFLGEPAPTLKELNKSGVHIVNHWLARFVK